MLFKQETPEVGRRTHQLKLYCYINKDEENSLKTMNNKIQDFIIYILLYNQNVYYLELSIVTFFYGGARRVIVIVVGNEHGDTSSNPGRD